MVDVQVRVHDEIDVLDLDADTRELTEQPGVRLRHELSGRRPEPGVDEHRRAARPREQHVDRQRPRLARVERRERLGDRREAAFAVDERGDVEGSEFHSGSGLRPANPSSIPCQ
jgi:hypothetical protein